MYNRYIPQGGTYTRVRIEDDPPPPVRQPESPAPPPPAGAAGQKGRALPELSSLLFGRGEQGGGVSGLLKALKLDDLDSGDVLLLLIVLFLLVEGDDLELVIALGLVLIMGLNGDKGD